MKYLHLSLMCLMLSGFLFIRCSNSNTQADAASTTEAVIPPYPKTDSVPPVTKPIPSLELLDLEGKPFNLTTLGGNPVVVFFDPECDHCQRECRAIEKRKSEFEGRKIYFVSIESSKVVRKFQLEYRLTDPQFQFATGDLKTIVNAMGPIPSVPCFYIYKDGLLAHRIEGEAEVDEILEKMK